MKRIIYQNEFIIYKDYAVMKVKRKDIYLDVLLDIEDVEKVKKVGIWHAIYDKTLKIPSYYITHRYKNKKKGNGAIRLHRLVTNCPENMVVDHINHNTLDNRKSNLKVCTHFINQQNLRSKTTEQTGVYFRRRIQKGYLREYWIGNISKNCHRYCKEFKTKEAAIIWRQYMEKVLYNEPLKEVMPQ